MVVDAASILMGLVLIRLGAMVVFRLLLPALRLVTPRIVEDLVVTALFCAWGLLWFRMAGVELGSLLATSAVITAVLAFSMKDTLGNVLGGVVLQLDQSVRVGDWVRIEDCLRPGGRDPLAPHRRRDAQPRDGRGAQQLADDQPLHL
jgi:small-conductance mechanosensitive channel